MPRFAHWHRWFMRWRSEGGTICATHPWESGRDNAPDWDGPMAAITPTGVGSYQRRDTAHVNPHMRPTKYDYDRYIWLVQRGRRLNWDEGALASQVRTFQPGPDRGGRLWRIFHPRKRRAGGGGVFTWTAAVWLGWISPNAEDL